ncbi:MAG: TonB-dependent receptor [Ferruginibacter sp.]
MKRSLLTVCLSMITYLVFAQQAITVKVTDARTGEPITNASATVRGSGKGASANSGGILRIQANANDVLEVTSIGYSPETVTLGTATEISVSLQPTSVDLGDVVFLGTRGGARAKTETAVPVDVIRINQAGLPTAKMDFTSVLNMAAPSFNYNKQSGADGADHVDLGTLRGLGPDQTLVLINGKRRHQTAFVALFGTRGRGNSGSDLNAFPEAAVDRIEILRDGASAQYGSDAMAGVMNILLRRDVNHLSVNTGWSGYYDTKFNAEKFNAGNQYYSGTKIDGNTYTLSVNDGFKLGKNGGFVNISLDYLNQCKTYRQADTTNWQNDKDALPYINGGRRAFGDGSVETYGTMYNMELPGANKKMTFYSFGGYNYKSSDAFAYTRNWSGKPERFPVDLNGNLLYDPEIMRTSNDGEIYYNPHIQTRIKDYSIAAGLKGNCHNWNWDLSNTFGRNDFHYYGDKTFNASMFLVPTAKIRTHFDDGGFNFLQNTVNLDLSRSFKTVAEGLNLGIGAEYRYEHYSIYKGEDASYKSYHPDPIIYPNQFGHDPADSARSPAAGSQGFPGFSPADVIKADRSNVSLYVDAELNVTRKWLVDGAVRFESYSDFGSVATFKFATRYKIAPTFNLRGSVSTGFRAPSLQQINFSNTLTSFSSGQLIQSRIARNGDAITKAAGIPDLKEETSVNASVGFSWKPVRELTFTIDGYMVKVKDRIVLSGLFSKDDPTLPVAFTSQLDAIGVSTAQFFDNAVNTTNYGLDVVIDYSKKWGKNGVKALLAGNFQRMTVDEIHVPAALNSNKVNQKTFFSDREEAFLLASAPNMKVSAGLDYNYKKFGVGTHLTYFGKIKLLGFGSGTADNPNGTGINPEVPSDADENVLVPEIFYFKGKLSTDVYASYSITKKISIFIGADNVFNVHPDLGVNPLAKGWFGDNESGGPWDSVQMGFNGRRVFAKLAFNF